jgi:poly-gamma-glutamate synthesis protein (capsule biosynthesis protein)
VAIPTWTSDRLSGIELHPISLGFGQPRTVRGRPMRAEPELAATIVGDLQRLSQPFGTTIAFRDGIGVVELTSRTSSREP